MKQKKNQENEGKHNLICVVSNIKLILKRETERNQYELLSKLRTSATRMSSVKKRAKKAFSHSQFLLS